MLNALRNRGPDAQHVALWNDSFQPTAAGAHNGLLHARLSIRDPRPAADQPMCNRSKDIWVCYNGEVYGWEGEAQRLAAEGFEFQTKSDTEFILHAYEAWGIETLIEKLRGMFSLAIVDLRTRTLHVLRDRLGLKPLVYYCAEDGFAFGSTVRSVIPFVPPAAREFSQEGIDAYLAHRYIPAPRTILKNITRLENGFRLRVNLDTYSVEKYGYWQPQAITGPWENTLDEAISLRTVSDRPVGVFLSGGVDSAVIATRLSRMGYQNIATYTAAFPGSDFDESAQAAALARKLGMSNHAIPIEPNLKRDFAQIVRDLDEPFADPSSIPTWYLARETVRAVTVVLGGDGGDELFGGYKRYRQHLRSVWRRGIQTKLTIRAEINSSKFRKVLAESTLSWEDAYTLRFSGFSPWQRSVLMPNRMSCASHYWRRTQRESRTPMDELINIDLENYLPEYVLRKADLCTMAHGLELRAPLLDHYLVQQILGLETSKRFTDPPKSAFLAIAPESRDALQRKKRGFNPPLNEWLLHDFGDALDELGANLSALTDGLLDRVAVDGLVKSYRDGAQQFAEQLLQLLILDESMRQLTDLATESNG